ncbi:MAG: orotidine 5'-phosphate decarboxylase / HUMPS family protein, partial [Pseudomonadota bacterium]
LSVGCDGVVASGLEASRIRQELGPHLFVVVPGVRPVQNSPDDQKRIVDVRSAFLNGADQIVVGRPIRQAPDPTALIREMQHQIKEALHLK